MRKKWLKTECHKAALKCSSRYEFQQKYPKQYGASYRSGWLNDICCHMEWKKNKSKYNFEICIKEAEKHNSIISFKQNNPSMYFVCRKNKWIKEISKHMKKLLNNWTFEDCKLIASKYSTKVEFKTNYETVYQKARKMKWLNKICEHMVSAKYGCKKLDFIECCNRNNNGMGIFYIINCYNDNENFYKIGITSQSISKRYKTKKQMPYNFKIILEIILPSSFIWDTEKYFKDNYKKYQYIPNIKFKGSSTECFIIHNL